jgi:hypothetical protein
MNNYKANVNFVFWAGVHMVFLGTVGIWSFTQRRIITTQYAAGLLIVSTAYAVVAFLLFTNLWDALSTNVLGVERIKGNIYFNVAKAKANPWDLGREENRRQVLGRRRSWLFFWTPTPIMKTGPVSNDRAYLAHPTGGGRNRAMVHSGAEEIELQSLSANVTQRR